MTYESTTIKTRVITVSGDCDMIKTIKTVVKVDGFRVHVSRTVHLRQTLPFEEDSGDEGGGICEYDKEEVFA